MAVCQSSADLFLLQLFYIIPIFIYFSVKIKSLFCIVCGTYLVVVNSLSSNLIWFVWSAPTAELRT